MSNATPYKHRITVEAHDGTEGSLGQPDWSDDAAWQTHCVRFFSVESTAGNELQEASQLRGEITYRLITRADSQTRTITSTIRS